MKSAPTRDSGVAWVGQIRADWPILPAKAVFKQRSTASRPDDVHLTPSQQHGVMPQADYMALTGNQVVLNLSGADNMRHVEPGDYISHLRSFQGGLEYSAHRGKVSAAYTVLTPRKEVDPHYFRFLFKSRQYVQGLQTTTDQMRDGQSIRYGQFALLPLPYPPLEEQRRIAEFLDRETAQIDELIAKQEQLISTLAERQAELRLRAVTRGLREGASLVESGVPWLGNIPEHWQIGGLGRRVRVTSGFPFKSDEFSEDESDWRLVRGINIGPQRIKWDETVYWARTNLDGLDEFELEAGDLVLGLDRPVVSDGVRVARLGEEDVPALLLQRVARVRPSRDLDVEFLVLVLSSRAFVDYLAPIFTGVSVPHMSPDQLKQFTVAFPPIAEQREIAAHVGLAESQTAELIHAARRFVETLQERRQALISAAVTGQIDVGGAF